MYTRKDFVRRARKERVTLVNPMKRLLHLFRDTYWIGVPKTIDSINALGEQFQVPITGFNSISFKEELHSFLKSESNYLKRYGCLRCEVLEYNNHHYVTTDPPHPSSTTSWRSHIVLICLLYSIHSQCKCAVCVCFFFVGFLNLI